MDSVFWGGGEKCYIFLSSQHFFQVILFIVLLLKTVEEEYFTMKSKHFGD